MYIYIYMYKWGRVQSDPLWMVVVDRIGLPMIEIDAFCSRGVWWNLSTSSREPETHQDT